MVGAGGIRGDEGSEKGDCLEEDGRSQQGGQRGGNREGTDFVQLASVKEDDGEVVDGLRASSFQLSKTQADGSGRAHLNVARTLREHSPQLALRRFPLSLRNLAQYVRLPPVSIFDSSDGMT